ncbi:hypothetical protein GGP68_003775 [Salinibacter ruber]|uniref:Uncharacterized protein n=1 Tax=Salinibacter ruber TaxID=146919 RepID=A0A9X2TGV7_9BACT|nr:hypothetical protein [Salinibacter ruber]MCS3712137.1 hypothetical protein [Salinibacter ruber]
MNQLLEKAQNRCANHSNPTVRAAWRDLRDRVKRLRDSTSVGTYGPASRNGRDDPSTIRLRKKRALNSIRRLREEAPGVSRQMDELEEEIRGIPARKGM